MTRNDERPINARAWRSIWVISFLVARGLSLSYTARSSVRLLISDIRGSFAFHERFAVSQRSRRSNIQCPGGHSKPRSTHLQFHSVAANDIAEKLKIETTTSAARIAAIFRVSDKAGTQALCRIAQNPSEPRPLPPTSVDCRLTRPVGRPLSLPVDRKLPFRYRPPPAMTSHLPSADKRPRPSFNCTWSFLESRH
jgi:hypothetical protein